MVQRSMRKAKAGFIMCQTKTESNSTNKQCLCSMLIPTKKELLLHTQSTKKKRGKKKTKKAEMMFEISIELEPTLEFLMK